MNWAVAIENEAEWVLKYSRFARKIASMYWKKCPRGTSVRDVEQEAMIGLLKAIRLYNHTRGCSFGRFAKRVIWQYLGRAMPRAWAVIRTPDHTAWQIQLIKLQHGEKELSRGERDVQPLLDTEVSAPSIEDVSEDVELLWRFLSCLNKREHFVITNLYGLTGRRKTLEQIGQIVDLTRERVRQIAAMALRQLYQAFKFRETVCDYTRQEWQRKRTLVPVPNPLLERCRALRAKQQTKERPAKGRDEVIKEVLDHMCGD